MVNTSILEGLKVHADRSTDQHICFMIRGNYNHGLFSDHVLTLPVIMGTVGKLLLVEGTQFPKWLSIIEWTAARIESIKLRFVYGLGLIIFFWSIYFLTPFHLLAHCGMGILIHFLHLHKRYKTKVGDRCCVK